MSKPLNLQGLDGANPLGFLAALGALIVSEKAFPGARLAWRPMNGALRPVLWGCGVDESEFVIQLHQALKDLPMTAFEVDKKLPFAADVFAAALGKAQQTCTQQGRRTADLLTAFGSEIIKKVVKTEVIFESSNFRMVRSGDAAGQGLSAYALAIRNGTDADSLNRTLFETWNYSDDEFSLRWDPLEDQRYALRWHDPSSQSNKKYAPQSMRGANALAVEALALFPAVPCRNKLATSGFCEDNKKTYLTWPIWEAALGLDVIRSLITLLELHSQKPPRDCLAQRGIIEIYRCERVAPNQYYKNFAPSVPA